MRLALENLFVRRPEISKVVRGLPNIGSALNGNSFSENLHNIEDAYYVGNSVYSLNYEHESNLFAFNAGGGSPFLTFPFPPVKDAINNLFHTSRLSQYGFASGDEECRITVSEYFNRLVQDEDGFLSFNKNQIIFMNSTTEAFSEVIRLICSPGDVVLFTAPTYGLFTFMPERVGAVSKFISLRESDHWLLNPESLNQSITEINAELRQKGKSNRVVAFVNLNPHNPTGKVMGMKEKNRISQLLNICNQNGVFFIDDIVYRDLCYDSSNTALPAVAIDNSIDNIITLFGTSKCYGLAGARSGAILAHEGIIRGLRNFIFQRMDSTPLQVSFIMKAVFNNDSNTKLEYNKYFPPIIQDYITNWNIVSLLINGAKNHKEKYFDLFKDIFQEFESDTDSILENGINGLGLIKNLVPESGFFAIVDFTSLRGKKCKADNTIISNENDVLLHFYKHANVKLLMGSSFAWPNNNQIVARVSYAFPRKQLIKMFKQLQLAILLLE